MIETSKRRTKGFKENYVLLRILSFKNFEMTFYIFTGFTTFIVRCCFFFFITAIIILRIRIIMSKTPQIQAKTITSVFITSMYNSSSVLLVCETSSHPSFVKRGRIRLPNSSLWMPVAYTFTSTSLPTHF